MVEIQVNDRLLDIAELPHKAKELVELHCLVQVNEVHILSTQMTDPVVRQHNPYGYPYFNYSDYCKDVYTNQSNRINHVYIPEFMIINPNINEIGSVAISDFVASILEELDKKLDIIQSLKMDYEKALLFKLTRHWDSGGLRITEKTEAGSKSTSLEGMLRCLVNL